MSKSAVAGVLALVFAPVLAPVWAVASAPSEGNSAAEADAWATSIVGQLTLDEKIALTHGIMASPRMPGTVLPADAVPGAGYVPGIPRLGVPAIKETDASLGVAYMAGLHGATALPSGLATASSWNSEVAYAGGAVAGQEARRLGFNVLLGGGVNLARDPRNGRNFEYLGEDPLLAGVLAGAAVRGAQSQQVVSTVKHFAINDQETGRKVLSANIDESAARESDLLAFEIAIERGKPGSVMCGYNRVNSVYACENDVLLNRILKEDWGYAGWVMSDWGAVHGVAAVIDGLDQESGEQLDAQVYFAAPLRAAVRADASYAKRLDDMDRRILRALHAVGADRPAMGVPLDVEAGARVARHGAEQGIVLLRNELGLLPLAGSVKRIAIIGGHADVGVLSGGGSSQVAPPQGPALVDALGGEVFPAVVLRNAMFMPSAPLKAMAAAAPSAVLDYDDGRDPKSASELAQRADVAVVFVTQWMVEGYDAADLSLPSDQDALIAAVAASNARTIVVLETGGPVLMPWLAQVGAVLEAWYPGIQGGEAIAAVLFGTVNPSGRLPLTFPAVLEQLPRPVLPGRGLAGNEPFDVPYSEGSDVGYRGLAKSGAKPLFPFGFGLSYTRFAHDRFNVRSGQVPQASVRVTNTGTRAGADVVQIYLTRLPQRQQLRLLGWSRVELDPGESREVTISLDPRLLAHWNPAQRGWTIDAGTYILAVGASATDLTRTARLELATARLKP